MSYEILLVNVSRDYSGFSEAFKDSIGQYLIASYLREKDFKAYVYSGDTKTCKKVIETELENDRTRVVGFYAAADNIRVVGHVIKWIKKKYPNIITVIGGPQVAGLDYNFFEETDNDYAIIGEGEIPMYYLLSSIIDNTFPLERVPSLIQRDKKEGVLLVNESKNALITDLDSLGFPIIEDSLNGRLRQGEVVGIITGRGCPFNCSFCYEGANAKNVRLRSIPKVMEEIDYIHQNNEKLNFISIYDDTFTLDKERILDFCNQIKNRKIMWFCEGHVTFVIKNKDVLKQMIEAGLACIQFGIESGSNSVLNAYNKHTNFDMIVSAIQICKELGIHSVTGNFIIGGAFESKDALEKSKQLAKELIQRAKGIIELYTVYFAPYPNTRMVREPEKFDITISNEFQELQINTMRTPVVRTRELSRNEIYDAKHEFDVFLANEYLKAGENAKKVDVIQGLFHNGKRISVNPTWERVYLSKPHISLFLEHMSQEEQLFNQGRYIIRTFEDFKIEGDLLLSDVGTFKGLEMNVLIHATGSYSANEMAEKFKVPLKEIERCYHELNNLCLVYMTEF